MYKILTHRVLLSYVLPIILLFTSFNTFSQCVNPVLYDIGLTTTSSTPRWVNCIDNPSLPNSFTLNLVSNHAINSFSVNWGDGNTNSGGPVAAGDIIATHTYTTLDSFTLSFTETIAGCSPRTITGKVINDRKTGASALPPTLGSSGCVPHSLTFINQSNNPSPHTRFTWEWGDQTSDITTGVASASAAMSHTYQRGQAGCNMTVRLTAQTMCATTFSSYGPFDFWDLDTALVNASATVLCNDDNVTFRDISLYNCNISYPRRIRWSWTTPNGTTEYLNGTAANQYWIPATPANRVFTKYLVGNPGDQYVVQLEDSNFCGIDVDNVVINFVNPPNALFTNNTPAICAGDTARLTNNSTGSPGMIYINWGDSPSWDSYAGNTNTFQHIYSTPNTYTIKFAASKLGSTTCADTSQKTIQVIPASVSNFSIDKIEGCGAVTVNFTESSTNNPISWAWDFGDGTTFNGQNPAPHTFTTPGTYFIELNTKNNLNCGIPASKTVTVYPLVTADFNVAPVCIGDTSKFFDASTIVGIPCNVGNIKIERFDNINGSTITDLINHADFPDNPTQVYDLSGVNLEITQAANNKNNYGVRIRGFICPAVSGNYHFYISSDDYSELWLSPSGDPGTKNKIAFVNGFTGFNQWNKYTSQKSIPITLVAGQSYYIEVLMKEGSGNDHLQVAWELPGTFARTPIPKSRLSPFVEGNAITSWAWNFADGTTSTDINPRHLYAGASTYNVQLQVSSGKCSATVTKPVVVNPAPTVDFSLPSYQSCTPFIANLTNLSTGAASYEWIFGDGAPNSTEASPTHTYNNVTNNNVNYTIELTGTSAAGCSAVLDRTITVYPGPVAGFQFSPILPQCSPAEITFEEKAIVHHPATFVWNMGDGTIFNFDSSDPSYSGVFNHVFTNTTGAIVYDTVRMQVTSSTGGCTGEAYKIVIVYPEPEFSIGAIPSEGCHPLKVNFFANGVNNGYQWNFGDGSPINTTGNPSHTYINNSTVDQVYKVYLNGKSNFGCPGIDSTIITVHPKPTSDFNLTYSSQCSPVDALFENNSSPDVVQYFWNFGDGNVNTTPNDANFNYEYNNITSSNQTYFPNLIVTNSFGCTDTSSRSLTAFPKVTAKYLVNDTAGCSPIKLNFANGSVNSDSYSWNFGDFTNSVATNPSKTFPEFQDASLRTYNVVLTSRNSVTGCEDTYSKTMTIYPKPNARFSVPLPLSGCSPFTAAIQNTTPVFSSNTYQWDFGDGNLTVNNAPNLSHDYVNESAVNSLNRITLYAENNYGCRDTSAPITVTVHPKVIADFTPTITSGCSPLKVNFINTSTPTNVAGFSYLWNFDDGGANSTNKDEQRTFYNSNTGSDRTYTVSLVSTSPASLGSCSNTTSKSITVHSKPEVALTIPPADTVGCSPHNATFSSFATSDVISKYWDFSDGNTSLSNNASVIHTYSNTGNFSSVMFPSIVVETGFGCKDTASVKIRVHPEVNAQFTPSVQAGCSPLVVNFINTSSPQVTIDQNLWNFNDGTTSTSQDVQHVFENQSGSNITRTVILKTTSIYGCEDQTSSTITVNSKPKANYDLLSHPFGCNPYPVDFKNTSSGGFVSSLWNFGDGSTDNSNNLTISHSYGNNTNSTKTYNFTLAVTSAQGCSDDTTGSVNVYPYMKADFNPTASIGCTPLAVGFQNFSIGSSTYIWDFGDLTSSTDTIPSKVFINNDLSNTNLDKNFKVRLIAESVFGCKDTLYKDIIVHPKPKVSFIRDKAEGCTPLNITFTNTSQPQSFITSNFWKWSDGTEEVNNNTTIPHIYYNTSPDFDKLYVVKLIAENTHQCKDSTEREIKVYSKIDADFVSTDTFGCSPHRVSFTNNSQGAINFNWQFGNSGSSSDVSPSYTFLNDAPSTSQRIDTIRLIAISLRGCEDTAYKKVLISPKPDSRFAITNSPGCSPLNVGLQNLSSGATDYLWVFGDNDSSNVMNPANHLYVNGTNNEVSYNPILYVSNSYGCRDTSKQQVTVWPQSKALFVPSALAGCTPLQIGFTNLSSNNLFNSWDYGDGTFTDPRPNPDHIFYNNGIKDTTYTVTLEVSTNRGCLDSTKIAITVRPRPIPQFTALPGQIIPEDSILFTNTTNGNWATYLWEFGDGTTSAEKDPGYHTYKVTGDYNVKLTVTSVHGCSSSFIDNIRVIEATPEAKAYGSGKGCQSVTVTFYNESFNSKDFTWDFGDGSPLIKTNNAAPIEHTYVNTSYLTKVFSITLKAQSPGGQVDYITLLDSVTVYPSPDIFFEARPDTVFLPDAEILFVNDTKPFGGTLFEWDFGDGSTSTQPNPTHSYEKSGVFDVTLKATTQDGCEAIKIIPAIVTVRDGGIIKMPNAFTPVRDGSKGNQMGSGINDVFAPGYHAGLKKYKLMIYNKWGELLFESNEVNTGWDGYYKGVLCQEDVYVFKVIAQGADGDTKEIFGDLTLIHK